MHLVMAAALQESALDEGLAQQAVGQVELQELERAQARGSALDSEPALERPEQALVPMEEARPLISLGPSQVVWPPSSRLFFLGVDRCQKTEQQHFRFEQALSTGKQLTDRRSDFSFGAPIQIAINQPSIPSRPDTPYCNAPTSPLPQLESWGGNWFGRIERASLRRGR